MCCLSVQADILFWIASFCDYRTQLEFKLTCKTLFNRIQVDRLFRSTLIGLDFFSSKSNEDKFFEAIQRLYIKPFQNHPKLLFCYKYNYKAPDFHYEVHEVGSFVELYSKVHLYRWMTNDNTVLFWSDRTRKVTLDEFFLHSIQNLKLDPHPHPELRLFFQMNPTSSNLSRLESGQLVYVPPSSTDSNSLCEIIKLCPDDFIKTVDLFV